MKISTLSLFSIVTLGVVVLSSGAHAQVLNGTFGYNPNDFDNISFDTATKTGTLDNTSGNGVLAVSSLPAAYLGQSNNFKSNTNAKLKAGLSNPTLITMPLVFTAGDTNSSFLSWTSQSGDTFTFALTNLTATSSASTNLSFEGLGTISDSQHHFIANTPAEFSASFTSTGSGPANVSFTFNTPPSTPEPGAVAMIVGLGVSGSAFAFRRLRRSK